MKGNFAWGSYGGFLAGCWRILGGTSASSRLNLGKFLAESRQVLSGRNSFQGLVTEKAAIGRQKASRITPDMRGNGCQRRPPRRPKAPLNNKNLVCIIKVFWNASRPRPQFTSGSFWLDFGSILGPSIVIVACHLFGFVFYACLEASGCIVGVMLVVIRGSLFHFVKKWRNLGSPNSFKPRMKCWMRLWNQEKGLGCKS